MQSVALFLRLWLWFSFRQLWTHRWRAIAVLLGIGIGASVFTSVRLSINASLDSFTRSMDSMAGTADWTIVHPGGRAPESLVPKLLNEPFIRTASPLLTVYVKADRGPSDLFLLVGLDPILDRPLRSWQSEDVSRDRSSTWLELMREPYTLFISPKLLEKLGLSAGDTLNLETMGRTASFRILERLAPKGMALVEGGEMAITDISTMQEFTGLRDVVDRIDLLLRPSATALDLEKLRESLPAGMSLARPTESKESGTLMIKAYQLNLSVLSFVSLFVGTFLVYSLVALNATSRRHELAVLRCIGASPRMLFLLFLAEGAFFGVMGWLLAIPLSSIVVKNLLASVSATISHLFVRVRVDRMELDSLELVLSFVVTVMVSVLAAFEPAREAMKVPPKEAFLMHDMCFIRQKSARGLALSGLALIVLVWPFSRLPVAFGIPLFGYVATFLLFAGFSLLSPWCLRMAGSVLPSLLKAVGGQPAYLGGRTMRDAGIRVAISVGALITAVALFVALVIMIHSFRVTVEAWVNQSIRGDLFLRPKMAHMNQYRDALPESLVARLQSMEGEVEVLPYRRIYLRYGNFPYQFETIDFDRFRDHGKFLLLDGNLDRILPGLENGEGVLVSEVFANQTGLSVGKHIGARIEGVNFDLPVLGIFRDYRTQGGVVHYSRMRFERLTGDRSWSGARVYLPGDDPAAGSPRTPALAGTLEEIIRICRNEEGIEVTLGDDLRREILRIFDETFAITTVLLFIALLVAALGIATTLAILVLDRTRELNTLLATGAGFGQILAMIFWEAILMTTAGVILGTGCGFILSYLLVFVINRQSFGWTFVYSVDWVSLATALPLVLATALIAALPATRLVFSTPPALVLRER